MPKTRWIVATVAVMLVCAPPTFGLNVPWDTFEDAESTSVCDLVNADNVELVVMHDTGELVIVTGSDVALAGSLVDLQGDVFIDGQPVGFITFAEDGDDFRTLWWVSLTGRAVHVDGLTGAVSESDRSPIDFTDVPCSACEFWDDQSICAPSDPVADGTKLILNFCGLGSGAALMLTMIGLTTMRCARRQRI